MPPRTADVTAQSQRNRRAGGRWGGRSADWQAGSADEPSAPQYRLCLCGSMPVVALRRRRYHSSGGA
jgi:hypothetical protein